MDEKKGDFSVSVGHAIYKRKHPVKYSKYLEAVQV